MNYVLIMAGGVGSRFWPASRESRPKQFLDILGTGKSLLRSTFERFLPICPVENIFILTHEKYTDLVLEHLPEIDSNQIIREPSRNNTAPCIAYAAFKVHQLDQSANLIVSPADHLILQESKFHEVLQLGLSFTAENPSIVTLGITPHRPDTGYGYIQWNQKVEAQVFPVIQFMEKPDLHTARKYLDSGDYVWNSGLFMFSTQTIVQSFRTLAPEIFNLLSPEKIRYHSAFEDEDVKRYYPQTPKISVDYAIMEKADNIYTIPADFGWSDLGTWKSLFEEGKKDQNKNSISVSSKAVLENSENNLIRIPEQKLAVIRGLQDYLIIDEGDVLLVYPKSQEQEIKKLTQEIRQKYGEEYL